MHKKLSWLILSVIILITGLSFIPLRNLRFEFDMKNFFPQNDTDLAFYQNYNERFKAEIDDEYIFIGLTSNHGIFNQRFLEKADSLTKYIAGLNHIIEVYSLTNLSYYNLTDGKMVGSYFIHVTQPELYESDSINLFQSPEVMRMQISRDKKSIVITAFNEKNLSTHQKDSIINYINEQLNLLNFDKSYFTAKIRVEKIYISETEKNLKIYLIV